MKHELPVGLKYHCDDCGLVVPADAPDLPNANCVAIAKAKLSYFEPAETLAGQFAMAAAAWGLIHRRSITGDAPHPEGAEYHRRFRYERKSHFALSALRVAMTYEQIAAAKKARGGRDRWLYVEDEEQSSESMIPEPTFLKPWPKLPTT
ncbi:hypothetical protein GOB94_14110 [Granulicella sp. 5B5]|uniref:hypothetical protein n=1 Tax=Granulicella sp. 5B5 TaxID=1617967 RepID=UPI0015F7111D|nr:hypothetical protein [Granulicella sp. 5B5]QMV19700.1 hypothetical protein GOB94_14110 [Granulicella sp. 5B5]